MDGNVNYGFQAHLSAEFPSQIVVDTTEHCNLACIHCPHAELTAEGKLGKVFLDVELHNKMVDEVAQEGWDICRYLRYTGQGETMMHPKIFEMLEYAVSHSKTAVNVTTNGTVLGEKRAKRLLDAGVHVVDTSIDAFKDETYAIVRKKGKLEKTRTNLLRLLEMREKGGYQTKVVVSFVEQPQNTDETEAFEKFWKAAGVDYVVIRRQHSAGGVKAELVNMPEGRYPCLYPWERVTLGPNGTLHYCPQDWIHGSEIGDFRHISIKEIWQGEAMDELRKAHLNNNFSCHKFCGNCPDWSTTRWPSAGQSYSNLMKRAVQASTEG